MKKDFFGRIKKPVTVSKASQVIKPILKVKEDPKPCVKGDCLPCWSEYICPAPIISPPWIAPRPKPKPKKPEPEPVAIPEPIPPQPEPIPEPEPEPTPRDSKMKMFLARLKK